MAERPAKQRPTQVTPTGSEDAIVHVDDEGTRNLDALTNDSAEGLTVVEHPDGSLSVDLEGRFQHVMRAHKTPDGKLDVSCTVDEKGTKAGPAARAWNPVKGRGQRLNVKGFKAPLRVAPKAAPALEVK